MQLNNAVTTSVHVTQMDEYVEHGFQFVRQDAEDAHRVILSRPHDAPMVIEHRIATQIAHVVPYRIRRPQSAHKESPLTGALDEVISTGHDAFGIHAVESMRRIHQLRFAYAMAKTESISLALAHGRRFALRIYSRFAASDLLEYIKFVDALRNGLPTRTVNNFSTRSFGFKDLPSNADLWWDTTHDAFFTFDANYATRLPHHIDREIEWRHSRR